MSNKLYALILIPEITKGMKSLGSKALLEIKKHITVLDHQIKILKDIDKNINICIATGFDSDKILGGISEHKDINIVHNTEYRNTNQVASIVLYLQKYNPDNLFIINNGILLKLNTISRKTLSGGSKLFVLDKPRENFNLGCSNDKKAEYIFYDLPEPWSECVFLNREAINNIKTFISNNATEQMYLFELLNHILYNHTHLEKHYIAKSQIMKITNIKDITKAKAFI